MNCPLCGEELKRSQKDPSYGLCYNCRKKFKLHNTTHKDIDLDEYSPISNSEKTASPKQASRGKKKGRKKYNIKKILLIVFGVFILFSIIGALFPTSKKNIANVVDMAADKASSTLKDAGFTNVEIIPNGDSSSKMIVDQSNWTVISQNPKADSKADANTKITLKCKKTAELSEEKQNQVTSALEKLIGNSLPDAETQLSELGYTAKYMHADSKQEITADLSVYSGDERKKWIVTGISSIDDKEKAVNIEVNTEENIAANEAADATRTNLEAKLESSYAWQAVADYGKSQYPYGFKLHYIVDKQAESAQDETTWFLKSSATIKNDAGAKVKMTCEAHVSGTTDNPQVIDFIVY